MKERGVGSRNWGVGVESVGEGGGGLESDTRSLAMLIWTITACLGWLCETGGGGTTHYTDALTVVETSRGGHDV